MRTSPAHGRKRLVGVVVLALAASLAHTAAAQQRCEASEYGVRPGESDNLAALAKALSECAGRILHIGAGTYAISPGGFATGLTVPAGSTIEGDGARGESATVLQIKSSGTFHALFWIRNVSNVTIRGLRIEGSSYESGCTRHLDYGHAIYIASDSGQRASVENVDISDNEFHNFNGQSWVTINAAEGSPGIGRSGHIAISKNVFDSDAGLTGGCAGSGGIGYPVAMVWLHGSDLSPRGLVSEVSIASNVFNAGYVKSAVAIWSGTSRVSVQFNQIRDAGLRLPRAPGTELGRYAILIYHSAHEHPGLHPEAISVIGNVITNPVSCGVYVAAGMDLEISGNRISGQSDRHDQTLPKGAIALNHAARVVTLRDNELVNNAIGISSVGSELDLGANRIVSGGGVPTKIVGGQPGWSQNTRE